MERKHRQRIITQARERQAEYRRGSAAGLVVSRSTNLRAWEVFNGVTATAREETHQPRVALERLAGELLDLVARARQ